MVGPKQIFKIEVRQVYYPMLLLAGKYIVNPNNKILHFEEITEELVLNACNHMNASFGYGFDNISSFFISLLYHFLLDRLHICLTFPCEVESFRTAGKLLGLHQFGRKAPRKKDLSIGQSWYCLSLHVRLKIL